MTFHSSIDSLPAGERVMYFAVCVPPAEVEAQILRHPLVAAAFADTRGAAHKESIELAPKSEYHCTLQFFSPPRDPAQDEDCAILASMLGMPVQMSVQYVAFTPKLAAIRLAIVNPIQVGLACANSCPHLTLAVGTGSQAVWSNELLSVLEDKQVAPHAAARIGWWRQARVVPLAPNVFEGAASASANNNSPSASASGGGGGESTVMGPIMLTGKVNAYVAAARSPGGGAPRYSPTSMSPSVSPGRGGYANKSPSRSNKPSFADANNNNNNNNSNAASAAPSWPVTDKRRKVSPQRGGGGGAALPLPPHQQQQSVPPVVPVANHLLQDEAVAVANSNHAMSDAGATRDGSTGPSVSPMRRQETLEPS